MTELYYKQITELAPKLEAGEISPVEITEAILNRIETVNEKVNAYITLLKEQAIANAKRAEAEIQQGNYRGVLHGIPVAVKDNIFTKGVKTTAGSKVLENFLPDYDATVVEKLRQRGALLLGKLNTHEFAMGVTNKNQHYGDVKNPWDVERIPGGSSGGSGAAVASGLTYAALGTDTGGSVRIPSAFCGVVGLKPTYGRVSTYGTVPLAWSLDHVGPLARSVADLAVVFEAIAGFDERDPVSANKQVPPLANVLNREDVKGITIAVPINYFFDTVEKEVEASVRAAIHDLEENGANVIEVSIPELDLATFSGFVTIRSEAATYHEQFLAEKQHLYGKDVRITLNSGRLISATQYLKAQQLRRHIQAGFSRVFAQADVIIAPTLSMTAPKSTENFKEINGKKVAVATEIIKMSVPMNLAGVPSLSIPVGLSSENLPIAMQIIGKPFHERTLFKVASLYEKIREIQTFIPIP